MSASPISDANAAVYVYNGEKLLYLKDGKLAAVNPAAVLNKILIHDLFLLLRPRQAYADITSEAMKLSFTDVDYSDWYYPYVRDLVHSGTVAGMTANTFAPKGGLTWGQALKLIALAVGESEQAAGSHWASGYMALAKDKGWIGGDVDLNAGITRLELCKVAAKAKGLTQQPASNPFTDCSDPSVLALVNAGVIHGMTETTFQPSGLLTRAQIVKIIWCMNRA